MNETKKTAVEVESLTYGYGDESILKNLSFCVPEGLFFTIIGPNGSGKTTLMKLMTGLEKPSDGRVKIQGKPIGRYRRRELARTAAFVPQMTAVDFPFTLEEVVSMGRSPHKGLLGLDSPEDLQIVRQSMAFTQVEHLAGRKLDKVSGGEQQRAFIARAICQQPRVIFLDEPTAALDLAHQVLVMDLMERLQKEKGVTVVMVSHDVNLACMYSHTLMLLKKGEIVGIGTPKEVLTYETLEAAYGCALMVDESPLGTFPGLRRCPTGFFRNPGENFLRVRILEALIRGQRCIVTSNRERNEDGRKIMETSTQKKKERISLRIKSMAWDLTSAIRLHLVSTLRVGMRTKKLRVRVPPNHG